MGVDLDIQEMTPAELLKLWEPQAKALAQKARSGEEVRRFLVKKGCLRVWQGNERLNSGMRRCLDAGGGLRPSNGSEEVCSSQAWEWRA